MPRRCTVFKRDYLSSLLAGIWSKRFHLVVLKFWLLAKNELCFGQSWGKVERSIVALAIINFRQTTYPASSFFMVIILPSISSFWAVRRSSCVIEWTKLGDTYWGITLPISSARSTVVESVSPFRLWSRYQDLRKHSFSFFLQRRFSRTTSPWIALT